jgi:excisionase family DNA binding protein
MADAPDYLNISQAADVLGVNRRRIRELIQAGELEAIANPLDRRETLIPRSEVDRLSAFTKKAVA